MSSAMLQFCTSMARRMTMASSHRLSAPFSTSSSPPLMSSSSSSAPVVCGRGDKRTKRGKRFKGSYGNSRPKKKEMIERLKDKLEVPRSTPWPLPFKLI